MMEWVVAARWFVAVWCVLAAFTHVWWLQKGIGDDDGENDRSVPLRECVCHAGLATTYTLIAVLVAP